MTTSTANNWFFMQGYKHKDAFIATEYPLPDTISDFWTMVHQRNVATIVMLNKLKEGTEVGQRSFYLFCRAYSCFAFLNLTSVSQKTWIFVPWITLEILQKIIYSFFIKLLHRESYLYPQAISDIFDFLFRLFLFFGPLLVMRHAMGMFSSAINLRMKKETS